MDELCKICERVAFGRITYTGFGHWRHDECAVGSQDWLLYFQRQSFTVKKVLREFYDYHKGRNYE